MSKKMFTAAALAACGMSLAAYADTAVTENTTVGGRAFIDLTSLDQQTATGAKTAASGFGLDVKRFYLIANHTFDDIWSANLTTDFNYTSGQTQSPTETQLFIKKAYLQAKISDAFWVRAGSADLAWVPFTEEVYGYRYVEQVLVDRLKFGTSADWGVHIGGKFVDGKVAYALSAVEGNGYRNPTRSKSLDVEGRLSFKPVDGLTAAVGFYSGKLGKDVEGTTTPPLHTATRYDALLAYGNEHFKIGGEYFKADNWNTVTATTTDSSDGFAITASVPVSSKASVFARYDNDKPSKDLAPNKKEDYYNAGVSCKPRKGVDLAVVWKHDEVKNNGATTSKSDEFGVWTQVSF